MKIKNLKHPFIFVSSCDEFRWFFFSKNRAFVTEHFFYKTFFLKWQNFATKKHRFSSTWKLLNFNCDLVTIGSLNEVRMKIYVFIYDFIVFEPAWVHFFKLVGYVVFELSCSYWEPYKHFDYYSDQLGPIKSNQSQYCIKLIFRNFFL